MKRILLPLIAIFLFNAGDAQTVNAYNPLVQNLKFSPEPSALGFQNCSETYATFNVGLTSSSNAGLFATQPLKVNICLQGFFAADLNPANFISGSHSSYFNWSYDILTNCIQGVQKSTLYGTGNDIFNIDPRALGEIAVKLQIAPYLPMPALLDVHVSLDVPNYMLLGNAPDDFEFVNTQNYIGVTSLSGTLYNDNANSNTPSGMPIGQPSNTPIYVNVIDVNTGLVEDYTLIANDGTYIVDSLRPDRDYDVFISTVQGTIGQFAPPIGLPSGWVFSSEDCCDNNSNDGMADGILSSISVMRCPMINANFAISEVNMIEFVEHSIPLDVNQLNFQVIERDCNAILFWNNSSDNEYHKYEIMRREKSEKHFTKIDEIIVDKTLAENYQYKYEVEKTSEENKSYFYQLRMLDMNTNVFVTPTKSITINCNNQQSLTSLYPNPAKNNINFLYENLDHDKTLDIKIIDVAGRTLQHSIKELKKGQNNIAFDVSQLPAGYYMLNYNDIENVEHGTLKFAIK